MIEVKAEFEFDIGQQITPEIYIVSQMFVRSQGGVSKSYVIFDGYNHYDYHENIVKSMAEDATA